MATFVVETSQTSRFTYEVEAGTITEAMEKVEGGDLEPVHEKLGEEEVNHTFERKVIKS